MTGSKPPLRRWSRLLRGRALPGCQRRAGHGGPGQGPGAERARGGEGAEAQGPQSERAHRPPPRAHCRSAPARPVLITSGAVQLPPRRGGVPGRHSRSSARLSPPNFALRARGARGLRVTAARGLVSPVLSRVIPSYPGISPPRARVSLAQSCGRIFVHALFTKPFTLSSQRKQRCSPAPCGGATQTAHGAGYANRYGNRVRRPRGRRGRAAKWPRGAAGREKGRPGAGARRWRSRGAQGRCPRPPLLCSSRPRPPPPPGSADLPAGPTKWCPRLPPQRLTPRESLLRLHGIFFFSSQLNRCFSISIE